MVSLSRGLGSADASRATGRSAAPAYIARTPPSTWISEPGDVGRLIGSQEQDGVRHFVDFSRPAHWNEAHSFGPDGRIGGATGCTHRRHDAGMNRVGADIVLAVLHRDPFGHQPKNMRGPHLLAPLTRRARLCCSPEDWIGRCQGNRLSSLMHSNMIDGVPSERQKKGI